MPLSDSQIETYSLLASAITPGPWCWCGNADMKSIALATTHSGRQYVMDFVRWGMRGAQPRFQVHNGRNGVMTNAAELIQFEVGDRNIVGVQNIDFSVYRKCIRGISHPDAVFIKDSPMMVTLLLEEVVELKARVAELENRIKSSEVRA